VLYWQNYTSWEDISSWGNSKNPNTVILALEKGGEKKFSLFLSCGSRNVRSKTEVSRHLKERKRTVAYYDSGGQSVSEDRRKFERPGKGCG